MGLQYAPGLIGYGTKGTDGTAGLTGLSTFFCEFDGTLDVGTIKNKIVNNLILFSTSTPIYGYPTRIYQTGDQFIDKYGKLFTIDLATNEKYFDTGQQLNSAGFFEIGSNTSVTPTYTRYSNSYSSFKFLLDTVYASDIPGNYAANPPVGDGIYGSGGNGIGAINYAEIKYVDNSINSYHPYTVYTNSTVITEPEKAFAITKEVNSNKWHIGNRDAVGAIRDIDLYLDFKNVFIDGSLQSTFSITNLQIPGWANIASDTSLSNSWANNLTARDAIYTPYLNLKNTGVNSLPAMGSIVAGQIHGGSSILDAGFLRLSAGGSNDQSYKSGIDIQGYGSSDTTLIRLWTAAAERMRITSSGNVGIGTTTPTSKLTVNGNVSVLNGNIGVGTINPVIDLEVEGDVSISNNLYLGTNGRGIYMGGGDYSGSNSYVGPRLNLGVGDYTKGESFSNISVGQGLNIRSGLLSNDILFGFESSGGYAFMHSNGNMKIAPVRNGTTLANNINVEGGFAWYTASSRGGDVNIKSGEGTAANGDILIKTGSALGSSGIINITSVGSHDGSIYIDSGDARLMLTGDEIYLTSGTGKITLNAPDMYVFGPTIGIAGAARFALQVDAARLVSGNVTGTSDIKYKNILGKINALKGITKLNGYYFNWNEYCKKLHDDVDITTLEVGVVAQEVEQIFPELVELFKDDQKKIEFKIVKYDKFVPYFVEAIKEQQNIINDLKQTIKTQESKINQLFELISNK